MDYSGAGVFGVCLRLVLCAQTVLATCVSKVWAGFSGVSANSSSASITPSTRSKERRGTESNRRMGLLQSPALPLGYPAVTIASGVAYTQFL